MKFIRKEETPPPREEHYISEDGKFKLKISATEWRYVISGSEPTFCIGVGKTLLDALKRARKNTAEEIATLTDRLKALDAMIDEENRIQETRLGHVQSEYTNETEGEKEHAE